MLIQPIADIHLEHHRDGGEGLLRNFKCLADVLVIAGDLHQECMLGTALGILCDKCEDVVYVFGNHELYGSSFDSLRETLESIKAKNKNLHVLDGAVVNIKGQRFVGHTLWFRFDEKNKRYRHQLSDFHLIAMFESQVYNENSKGIRFLEETVGSEDVVVTHHLPVKRGISKQYENSQLNRFFLCDMSELVMTKEPKLWIFGHTHTSVDFKIGKTRFICNVLGYPMESSGFKDDLTILI